MSRLQKHEPMSCPLHRKISAFGGLAPHFSSLQSFAKLPTVEVEAAAPPGVACCGRFRPLQAWGGVGNGWARGFRLGFRLATRHAVAIRVKHLGSSAYLGDTPSISLLLAGSTTGHAETSTAGLEVLE